MPDRMEGALRKQKAHFLTLLAMMRSGAMAIQIDGKPATKQTAAEFRKLVLQIDEALPIQKGASAAQA